MRFNLREIQAYCDAVVAFDKTPLGAKTDFNSVDSMLKITVTFQILCLSIVNLVAAVFLAHIPAK
jgi:hypothetical protein